MKEHDFIIPVEIEQYERKIYDLKQIIEISKGLSSTLDYNTLIDSILLTCMGQMQLLKAGIFLRKGIGFDSFSLHRNYKGFEVDHAHNCEIPSNSKIIQLLESDFKCFSMNDILELNEPETIDMLKLLDPSLFIPLINKGELNGIMILGERIRIKEFADNEKEFILYISSLAGIAIQNARLYEMATTDMMTRLKMHHYFQTTLMEEFDRAIKYERPLSLIMSDIDHFKNLNDTYGHSAGDEVLKKVANIIKESIRPMDIAARYGGEEFAIIMPKTEITEALIAAERIRGNIEDAITIFNDNKINITISIGISQLDKDIDKIKNDLLDRADKALYISKRFGRNKVSLL